MAAEPNEKYKAAGEKTGRSRLLLLAVVLFVLGILSFWIDFSVTRYCKSGGLPGDIRAMIRLSEVFAHGTGVAWIVVSVWVLCPELKRKIIRLAACTAVAGVVACLLKMVISRVRPKYYEDGLPESVFDTFCGVLPWLDRSISEPFEHKIQSIPSGHTAAAVGLAIGLTWLFPRGKWLFTIFAVLAALQRIDSESHYLSDTLFGASIACLVGFLVLQFEPIAGRFTRFETKSSTRVRQAV